jgi:hypothetical protein
MPLRLPQLDDRTYADLLDEARALIPGVYPAWTDHNPSDPGITLIELFAWLTEMLIYRADQVPDRHRLVFLRLLNGPDRAQSPLAAAEGLDPATRERLLDLLYAPGQDGAPAALVDEAVRLTVLGLRRQERAITAADYEQLARESSPLVARVRCLPGRNLEANTQAEHLESRPGHVSVIVVPRADGPAPLPDPALLETVWQYLDGRRTLTTRHHAVAPFYAPVGAEILVARRADARDDAVRDAVVAACAAFLHPLTGGPDGAGWPFGRDVFLSELYTLIEGVPGVDYVPDITLDSVCEAGAARCVAVQPLWHASGDQVGLGLAPHHLPRSAVVRARVVVAAAFVPLRIAVSVALRPGAEQAAVYRAIKTALKRRLHPLHGGPNGASNWSLTLDGVQAADLGAPWDSAPAITLESLRAVVRAVPGVQAVADVRVASDARWLIRNGLGEPAAFGSRARELVDAQVVVATV